MAGTVHMCLGKTYKVGPYREGKRWRGCRVAGGLLGDPVLRGLNTLEAPKSFW